MEGIGTYLDMPFANKRDTKPKHRPLSASLLDTIFCISGNIYYVPILAVFPLMKTRALVKINSSEFLPKKSENW